MISIPIDQIDSYLINKVNFRNWKLILEKDRVEFLNTFVKQHVCNIYFNNLGLASTEPENRCAPTESEIIENGLSGRGGICNQLNRFAKHLLDNLGFETFNVAASWSALPVTGTHLVLIVSLDSVAKYLIDIGSGSPNFEAIPLHKLPYKGKSGGYEYGFNLDMDGISYHRMQYGGSLIKGDFKDHVEEVRYTFQLKPVINLTDILPTLTYIYKDPFYTLQKQPFIFSHLQSENSSDDENAAYEMEFIIIWGKTVVKGKRDSREIIKYETYEELVDGIINNNYFPNLDKKLIEITFNKFKHFEPISYRF